VTAEQVIGSPRSLSGADRALFLAIRKTLWNYEPLRATRPALGVEVEDGRVRLSGRMRTLAMKEIAEYLLRRVDGVRAVRNDVVADPEVVRAVADALAADDKLAPVCIRVDVRNGDVLLMGTVADEGLVQRAQDVAGSVPQVSSVQSRLVVSPDASPAAGSTDGVSPGPVPATPTPPEDHRE